MYGNQLPQTGFSVVIYAVVGLVSLIAGLYMKAVGRR